MLWPRTLNLKLGTWNYSFYRFFTSNFAAAGGNFPPSVVSSLCYGRLEHHHPDRVRRGASFVSDAVRAAARPARRCYLAGRVRRGLVALPRRHPRRHRRPCGGERGREERTCTIRLLRRGPRRAVPADGTRAQPVPRLLLLVPTPPPQGRSRLRHHAHRHRPDGRLEQSDVDSGLRVALPTERRESREAVKPHRHGREESDDAACVELWHFI